MLRRKPSEDTSDRPRSRRIRVLAELWPFLAPYRVQILLAAIALSVAAGTVLAMGKGLRVLVDEGLVAGDRVLIGFFVVVILLAVSSYSRFYYVSWVGERLVADLRQAVFRHVLKLSPAFFEVTRTGEVLSRLTTDTTLLQAVISATASTALRNMLLFLGGIVLLFVSSLKLAALVIVVVPAVLVPILVLGRQTTAAVNFGVTQSAELFEEIKNRLHRKSLSCMGRDPFCAERLAKASLTRLKIQESFCSTSVSRSLG